MTKTGELGESIGSPLISRVVPVPTDVKDEWLRLLNERKRITAGPIEHFWTKEGEPTTVVGVTFILVSIAMPYDRPRDLQARLGVPDPTAVVGLIDESIRYVSQRLSR